MTEETTKDAEPGPDKEGDADRGPSVWKRLLKAVPPAIAWGGGALVLVVALWIVSTQLTELNIALRPTYGDVFVDTPQVYTRERLVEDRYIQDAWIRGQLEGDLAGPGKPPSPAAGAPGEATAGTGTAVRASVGTASQASLSQLDVLEERFAVRDRLRTLLRENRLDDRHDLDGSTLYLLKFSVSVAPGERTAATARVRVFVNGQSVGGTEGSPDGDSDRIEEVLADEPGAAPTLAEKVLRRWSGELSFEIERRRKKFLEDFAEERASGDELALIDRVIDRFEADPYKCSAYWGRQLTQGGQQDPFDRLPEAEASSGRAPPPTNHRNLTRDYFVRKIFSAASTDINTYTTAQAEVDFEKFLDCVFVKKALEDIFTVDNPSNLYQQYLSGHYLFRYFGIDLNETNRILVSPRKLDLFTANPPGETGSYCDDSAKWEATSAIKQCQASRPGKREDTEDNDPIMKAVGIFAEDRSKYFCVQENQYHGLLKYAQAHSGPRSGWVDPSTYLSENLLEKLKPLSASSMSDADKGLPKWWCDWSVVLNPGVENFRHDVSTRNRIFTYAVFPRNVARRVNYQRKTEATIRAQAEISSEDSLSGEATEGLLVSFADAELETCAPSPTDNPADCPPGAPDAQGQAPSRAVFGWLIYPTRDSRGVKRQQAARYDASALVSAPGWMEELHVEVETTWLDASGKPIGEPHWTKFPVKVPGDFDQLLSQIGPAIYNAVEIDRDPQSSLKVTVCQPASIILTGRRLWRGTVVTLGGQVADEIRVLPDMRGIVARFDKVLPPVQEGMSSSKVVVWTSEGRETLESKVDYAIPDNFAGCGMDASAGR